MATAVNMFGNLATDDTVILLRRIVKLMEASANVDAGNRQRVTVDSITGGSFLSTVSSVTNVAAMAGLDQRQFHDMARTAYNTGVRAQLNFIPPTTALGV